jgi:phosphate transport system substrate-binding protein
MFCVCRRLSALLCLIFAGIGLAGVLLAGFLTVACNSNKQPAADIIITAAGSTFINPAMTRWIAAFQASHPGVQINYQAIGSASGIEQLKQGLVDFGASDAALDDEKLKDMPPLVQIPESAGPVCITYNLPELQAPLKLSGATLASIYLGEIKWWQDPAIQQDNEGVRLPNHPIAVVHRSDGSGTTNIFTMYLAKASPVWTNKVGQGTSINWPAGVGGKGSAGVAEAVKQTPGGIGYIELAYAKENKLPAALVRNQAGAWIEPTAEGATAAVDAFQRELVKDVRTPVVDPPDSAREAYPISGLTYLLVPLQAKDTAKQQIVKEFVQYIITEGQAAAQNLQYATLPLSLAGQDQKLLGEIQAPANSSNQSGR